MLGKKRKKVYETVIAAQGSYRTAPAAASIIITGMHKFNRVLMPLLLNIDRKWDKITVTDGRSIVQLVDGEITDQGQGDQTITTADNEKTWGEGIRSASRGNGPSSAVRICKMTIIWAFRCRWPCPWERGRVTQNMNYSTHHSTADWSYPL